MQWKKLNRKLEMNPVIDIFERQLKFDRENTTILTCVKTAITNYAVGKIDEGRIKLTFPSVDRSITTCPLLLSIILKNVLENAIKFSKNTSGCIEIKVKYYKKNVSIKIADGGLGIPDEDKKHIFTPFFRAKNVTHLPGVGLGLRISKKFAQFIGGEIQFASVDGKGSSFDIRLPYDI